MHTQLADELAKATIDFVKPLMHARTTVPRTNALENSLNAQKTESASGFEIDFWALYYGLYVDTGNDDLGEAFASTYGLKAFPVDKRLGPSYARYAAVIHPMGSQTPEAPTHYSEKAVEWLTGDEGAAFTASKLLETWLESVVVA